MGVTDHRSKLGGEKDVIKGGFGDKGRESIPSSTQSKEEGEKTFDDDIANSSD